MANCDVVPFAQPKACSGKCREGACRSHPEVWVLAICEGMAALFEKEPDGRLHPLPFDGSVALPLVDALRTRLSTASDRGEFNQLVLVGSANDISWTQISLSGTVSKHIVAEIQYPLISTWFRSSSDLNKLQQALENLF